MKIALLICGFPRIFRYTIPYLREYLLKNIECDIFFAGFDDIKNGISKDEVIDAYSPKKYFIREWNGDEERLLWESYGTKQIFNNSLVGHLTPIKTISQYYNLFLCNELRLEYEKEIGFEYDVVVRIRTDYFFYKHIKYSNLTDLKKRSIYMPNLWDFDGYTDAFAYGDNFSMGEYCNLFKRLRDYNLNKKVPFRNEDFMKYHIDKGCSMNRIVVDTPFWFDLRDFKSNGFEDRLIDPLIVDSVPSRRNFL